MSSPIDLCLVSDVRAWLGMNPQQAAVVSTTIAVAIVAGTRTVTPLSMANILVQSVLGVGAGTTLEFVIVTAVSGTTFTAVFALGHSAVTPIPVSDVTNMVLARVITAASLQWLRRTGRDNQDGTPPTVSSLVQQIQFDEWYDGNGGTRLFLRQTPVASVASLTISGWAATLSTSDTVPGYVIHQDKKSLAFRSTGLCGTPRTLRSSSYRFAMGVQNVHAVYTAGYNGTPDDVVDACIEMVGLNYKRRNWIDQTSNSQPDVAGTIRYRDWELTPKIVAVMDTVSRNAMV